MICALWHACNLITRETETGEEENQQKASAAISLCVVDRCKLDCTVEKWIWPVHFKNLH